LVGRQFAYPITLTSIHLAFQTIGKISLSLSDFPPCGYSVLTMRGTATRLLHRYTDLISGPAPSNFGDYFSVPLKDSNEGADHQDASERVAMSTPTLDSDERKRWKRASVAMDWSSWNREMSVSLFHANQFLRFELTPR
jgi:hypothetical protein